MPTGLHYLEGANPAKIPIAPNNRAAKKQAIEREALLQMARALENFGGMAQRQGMFNQDRQDRFQLQELSQQFQREQNATDFEQQQEVEGYRAAMQGKRDDAAYAREQERQAAITERANAREAMLRERLDLTQEAITERAKLKSAEETAAWARKSFDAAEAARQAEIAKSQKENGLTELAWSPEASSERTRLLNNYHRVWVDDEAPHSEKMVATAEIMRQLDNIKPSQVPKPPKPAPQFATDPDTGDRYYMAKGEWKPVEKEKKTTQKPDPASDPLKLNAARVAWFKAMQTADLSVTPDSPAIDKALQRSGFKTQNGPDSSILNEITQPAPMPQPSPAESDRMSQVLFNVGNVLENNPDPDEWSDELKASIAPYALEYISYLRETDPEAFSDPATMDKIEALIQSASEGMNEDAGLEPAAAP